MSIAARNSSQRRTCDTLRLLRQQRDVTNAVTRIDDGVRINCLARGFFSSRKPFL